jgi:hypothetical protein
VNYGGEPGLAQNAPTVAPVVNLVQNIYQKGVKVFKNGMRAIEKRLSRKPGLEQWFITVTP